MNHVLQLFLLCALGVYYCSIFYLLRRKSLMLKYTLVWLLSGIIMFLAVIFPSGIQWIITRMGIIEMTNGIFAVCIFCVLLILISLTGIVSKMSKKNKDVIQQCALMEKRIRELERGKQS